MPTGNERVAARQRAASPHGRAHKPDLTKVYRHRAADLDVRSLEYRTTLLRPKGVKPHRAEIDHLIQSVEWRFDEGDPVMHGTLVLGPRDNWAPGDKVSAGDTLMLSCKWYGKWTEVWRMMLVDPSDTLAGGVTFGLEDPLFVLQQSTDHWRYVKSKRGGHPNGWRAHEITRDVARRYGIPLGKVAAGRRRINNLSYDDYSPLQIIQRAYALEKAATGHRFVMRWDRGKLHILPMRRNPILYVLSSLLEDALIGKEARGDDFATAVTLRATVKGKGGKPQKIVARAQNRVAVRSDGFVHRTVTLGDVKGEGDAREKLKRHLNKVSQRKRTLTGIRHPLIPFIRRGDAVHVSVPSRGLTGTKAIAFVSAGSWSLSGGVGTMSLDVTFDDPYATASAARKAKDKRTRARKQAARK